MPVLGRVVGGGGGPSKNENGRGGWDAVYRDREEEAELERTRTTGVDTCVDVDELVNGRGIAEYSRLCTFIGERRSEWTGTSTVCH